MIRRFVLGTLITALLGVTVSAAGPPKGATGVTVPGAGKCAIFPNTNVWNRPVTKLPVAKNSKQLISSIGTETGLHPDFGSDPSNGIPYNLVGKKAKKVRFTFDYADQSDQGPYPIPAHPKIEAGSDHHLLVLDKANCHLYELFAVEHNKHGWHAGSGAIWNLDSNALRPDGWTSADAAGLPILPGLVRYSDIQRGVINHALRFTAMPTRSMHIYPARHDAGSGNDPALPPMGLRVRLKASVSLKGFDRTDRILLTALKTYGMILADNGSPWFISGAPDNRWNDDTLHLIDRINGSDFQVVDTSHFRNG
ncbi:MAG TPA: hypothetical protein VFB34_04140 [Chloroflexota bacterium]|nr:hypothetical protein [Chloroflexota bacterium]